MTIYYKGKVCKDERDAVEKSLGSLVLPDTAFTKKVPPLYAAKIKEITNRPDEDYLIKLLCFDADMRRYDVTIHSPSLDWYDFITANPKTRTYEYAEMMADLLKQHPEIERTEIIHGIWLNMGCEKVHWVRGYLSYHSSSRFFLSSIKMLNEIIIGNTAIASSNLNNFGKVKIAGVPLYQWFTVDKVFKGSMDGDVYECKASDDTKCTYNFSEGIWIYDNGTLSRDGPPDETTIHVNLVNVKLDPHNETQPVYPWLAYDIEVLNSQVLNNSNMPDLLDAKSYINVISMQYYAANDLKHEFSIAVTSAKELGCEKDVICVSSERELVMCFLWAIYLTKSIYVMDYNGLFFDQMWISQRISLHKLQDVFCRMFRMPPIWKNLVDAMSRRVKSTSAGKGKHSNMDEAVNIRTKMFEHVDLMYYISTRNVFDRSTGESLNAVAAFHGLKSKIDIQHWRISLITITEESLRASADKAETSARVMKEIQMAIKKFRIGADAYDFPEYVALRAGDYNAFHKIFLMLSTLYVDYCLRDAEICAAIALKNDLINTLQGMGCIYGLPLNTVLYNGINVTITNCILMFATERDYTFHLMSEKEISRRDAKTGDIERIGGITFDVYDHNRNKEFVGISFDLKGAYSAAIKDFNLSPEMIYMPIYDKDGNIKMPFDFVTYILPCADGKMRTFCVRQDVKGLISMFEEYLIGIRAVYKDEYKRDIKLGKSDFKIRASNTNQNAIKLVANGTYGQFGSAHNKNSWIHSDAISSMTTISTALTIIIIVAHAFAEYGLIPMLGVTDSTMFRIEPRWCRLFGLPETKDSMYKIAKKIAGALNKRINDVIKAMIGDDCMMELEFENIITGLMNKKMKRYASQLANTDYDSAEDAHKFGKQKVIGYNQIRQNTSAGVRELSASIINMSLSYVRASNNDIAQFILDYFANADDQYTRWANFERVSFDSVQMRTFQGRMDILARADIGYPAAPAFRTKVYVLPINYNCRGVNINTAMQDLTMGMQLMPAEEAKRTGMKIQRRKIRDRIEKVVEELLGIKDTTYTILKALLDRKYPNIKAPPPPKMRRVEVRADIKKMLSIESLKYVDMTTLSSQTDAYRRMVEKRMIEIDPNYIANQLIDANPLMGAQINKAKTFLMSEFASSFTGLAAELCVQYSMAVADESYMVTNSFVRIMDVIRRDLYEFDCKVAEALSHIRVLA